MGKRAALTEARTVTPRLRSALREGLLRIDLGAATNLATEAVVNSRRRASVCNYYPQEALPDLDEFGKEKKRATVQVVAAGAADWPHGQVPVLWRHAKHGGPIGEVVYLERNEDGIYIRAVLHTHEAAQFAWRKIVLGEVSGLSCASENDESLHLQAEAGGARFYDKWKIKEVSLTPTPANKDCHFAIYAPGKTL